jgi:putative ABC transport system permease protein
MNLLESVYVALEGLKANKLRASLTMLGIIIGVGSVIAMLAIGQGMRKKMMTQIESMGTNVLMVFSGQMQRGGVMGGMGSRQNLTLDDAAAILKDCPSIVNAVPEVSRNAQVKYSNKNTNTSILGSVPAFLTVRNFKIASGRVFNEREVKAMQKVAVIGPTTATNLFGTTNPVGKTISVKGSKFLIIGLLVAKGASSGFGGDPDDQVVVPVTTAMRRLFGMRNVRSINLEAKSMDLMDVATDEIKKVLRKTHKIAEGADDDFIVRNQAEAMTMANDISGMITAFLGGIAAISLLVGGIGIMNIMLVSVTERTREIGIRMAVGARRHDIQMQFLVEALVISFVGGIMGILLGVLIAWIMGQATGWTIAITPFSVLLSFGFSALIGVVFGIYPALKASRLDPIDALRYE